MIQIEHNIPKLLYRQIVEWMDQQLTSGAWPEHYKLKPEIELAADLGVNRGTVRKAIGELIAQGRLVRIHGRGTFVASATLEQPLAERLIAFSEDLIEKKIPFETRILEQAVTNPSQQVASLLALSPQAKVFVLKRVRIVAQAPLILLHNYIAYKHCPGIERIDFTHHRLFKTLEKHFDLELDWGRRTFQAQSADDAIATHLNISRCDPVMYLEQLVYLRNGSPIEFSNVWIRGDRFRLSANVKRNTSRDSLNSSNEYI